MFKSPSLFVLFGYITVIPQSDTIMTYSIRKQDTITTNYGVFFGNTLVEGGFRDRSSAWDSLEWFKENHPNGPENVREVAGWWT